MEGVNLRKLNDVKVKEQYQVKPSNRFAAFENFDDDDVVINKAWESITENMKASATDNLGYVLKQQKPLFDSVQNY